MAALLTDLKLSKLKSAEKCRICPSDTEAHALEMEAYMHALPPPKNVILWNHPSVSVDVD